MKVGSSRPGSGTGRTGAVTTRAPAAATSTPAAAASAPTAARSTVDSAQVMGIPQTEFTPKVRAAITNLMTEIDRLRRELTRTQARLSEVERMADQDALVPVNNRRAFMRELSRVLHFAGRYGSQASLIYFDLNGLKQINDTLGHAAGDAAISKVAELLKSNVRDFDVVGRLGGDEFAVVLAQTPIDQAAERAEHLARIIRATTIPWQDHLIHLDVAYGVHPLALDTDPAAAIAAADRAMYVKKQAMKRTAGAAASAVVVKR